MGCAEALQLWHNIVGKHQHLMNNNLLFKVQSFYPVVPSHDIFGGHPAHNCIQ